MGLEVPIQVRSPRRRDTALLDEILYHEVQTFTFVSLNLGDSLLYCRCFHLIQCFPTYIRVFYVETSITNFVKPRI